MTDCERAKRKAAFYNAEHGKLTGYDCPECLNRGDFLIADENGDLVYRECRCMTIRRNMKRMEKSGLAPLLEIYTLAKFQTPERWQEIAKEKATDYLKNGNSAWFVASGCVGSGKSHLCTAICGELMTFGNDVRYMMWRDDGAQLKSSVNDRDAYQRLILPLKTARVLYIDDFWKGSSITDGDKNLAFELLNNRYVSGKRTIISTEKTIQQILDVDEATGSRIYQKSKGYYLRFPAEKNWRMKPDEK